MSDPDVWCHPNRWLGWLGLRRPHELVLIVSIGNELLQKLVSWVDNPNSGMMKRVVVAKQITIAPGGTTGWQHHDGPVVGIVEAGTLTHPGADCKPVIFETGALINEPSGQVNTHVGRNLGSKPVILDVVYLQPIGDPLFEDVPAPPCDNR